MQVDGGSKDGFKQIASSGWVALYFESVYDGTTRKVRIEMNPGVRLFGVKDVVNNYFPLEIDLGGNTKLSKDLEVGGYVRIKGNELFWNDAGIGENQYVGIQAKTADNFHFHILPCDNNGTFINNGNYGYIGNSTYYWYALFARYVRYKTLSSFEHLDDISMLKKITTTVEEIEEIVKGKKVKKKIEVWDRKTMPHVLDESGEFIDAGKLNGFLIGVLKQLVEKVEILEARLKTLEKKLS